VREAFASFRFLTLLRLYSPNVAAPRRTARVVMTVAYELAAADKSLAQSKSVVSTGCYRTIDRSLRKGGIVREVGVLASTMTEAW